MPSAPQETEGIFMAVAAETQTQYQLVDELPEVAEARQFERQTAVNILNRRKFDSLAEHATGLPLPVDALSTAHKVLDAANNYGQNSQEHTELLQGLHLDCQRLVAEWYRKKKPEYFPAVRHVFDMESEEFFSHGLSVRQMTENALVPISNDAEEEARRINERVEDATPQILRGLGAVALGQSIRTISECTDKALHDYAEDQRLGRPHSGYGGYVPEIQKLMVRDIRLDIGSNDRFEEQIGLPGVYITHEIIQKALEERGATVGHMGKTELHGTQLLVCDDLMEFVAHLDKVASEQWCTTIFMGEEVPEDYIKNYAAFRQEALIRQTSLKDIAAGVSAFVLGLAADGVDRKEALTRVEGFVKMQLLNLGKKDSTVAEQMFDAPTARGLQEVAYLESVGQYQQASERMQVIEQAAPGGGYCGAGSCGLVAVGELTSQAAKARELGLGNGLIYDTVRSCPGCKQKNVYYDAKGNKGCTGCGKSQINGKTKQAPKLASV